MTTPVVVLTALSSALAAASSTVLQHRAAQTTAATATTSPHLLGRIVRRPLWLAGLLAAGIGLLLHAAALAGGHLALVQPLLVSGLLFALPVSAVLEGRRPSLTQLAWAAVLTAALAVLLITGHPVGGRATAPTRLLLPATLVTAVSIALVTLVGVRLPARRGALLGLAAGMAFGLTSALLKQVTGAATLAAVLLNWPTYVLAAAGLTAIVLAQLAYRAAPLAAAMPGLAVGDPIVSILIGILAFRERVALDAVAVTAQAASLVTLALAAPRLAERQATNG